MVEFYFKNLLTLNYMNVGKCVWLRIDRLIVLMNSSNRIRSRRWRSALTSNIPELIPNEVDYGITEFGFLLGA